MRIEIQGSDLLPHMSIMKYRVSFEGQYLRLLEAELTKEGEALALLLNEPNISINRTDNLVPCFDIVEMQRRNVT